MTVATGCRHRMTDDQVRTMWTRLKRGDSLTVIGEALALQLSSLYGVVRRAGGIVPPPRTRAERVLSSREREGISRGLASARSVRAIAHELGRAPSTISREIARHGGRTHYRAEQADRTAWHCARRPQRCRLATSAPLRRLVARKLRAKWAPQQIAGWLVTEYPDDLAMRISHETIYRSLYVQARGVLKKELVAHLRRRRPLRRRPQGAAPRRGGRIVDAVSIADRPAAAADRAIPGHWEGDLLSGAGNSHIATLVERRSRYVLLVRVRGKDTASVVAALIRRVQRLPEGLMASLTWDRGTELAQHKRFTVATDVQVYFCDPQSPWQRGSNENTNGLLRQYFPHGTDLTQFSQRALDAVACQLNARPRQTLGFRTPAAILAATVAPTN
jgi:IS30 family transposase